MQLKGLINRQRASYQKVLSDMDEDDSDAQVQLELLEVETCVAHFVHLLAHHPELTSADGVAAAVEFHKQQGRDGPLPSAVALKELVTAGADSGLKQWANGVGRNGLLKGMTDQMDFLLKALFEGQQNLQNAELINAILRTIHEVSQSVGGASSRRGCCVLGGAWCRCRAMSCQGADAVTLCHLVLLACLRACVLACLCACACALVLSLGRGCPGAGQPEYSRH